MKLRPFFSFFGSKYRLAVNYPVPTHDTVIEPFAGSAGYSLLHSEKEIILNDLDPIISGLWKWLISASEEEIIGLPDVPRGKTVDDFKIREEAKWLIGFWLTESQTYPSKYHLSPSRNGSWGEKKRQLIASQLKYIRHWRVISKSYNEISFTNKATWFIDPPYYLAGKRYKKSKIDYSHLGEWSLNRNGEVIVCEQEGANWLPFKTLRECKNGSNKKYTEIYFHSLKTDE